MNAAHSLGPWHVALKSTPFSDYGVYDTSGSLVATVSHNPRYSTSARRKADAQLVAAAPEMLKALEMLTGKYGVTFQDAALRNFAVDVIRKATGAAA